MSPAGIHRILQIHFSEWIHSHLLLYHELYNLYSCRSYGVAPLYSRWKLKFTSSADSNFTTVAFQQCSLAAVMALAVAPEGYRSGSRSPRGKSDATIHVGLDGCAANPEEVLRGGFTEEMKMQRDFLEQFMKPQLVCAFIFFAYVYLLSYSIPIKMSKRLGWWPLHFTLSWGLESQRSGSVWALRHSSRKLLPGYPWRPPRCCCCSRVLAQPGPGAAGLQQSPAWRQRSGRSRGCCRGRSRRGLVMRFASCRQRGPSWAPRSSWNWRNDAAWLQKKSVRLWKCWMRCWRVACRLVVYCWSPMWEFWKRQAKKSSRMWDSTACWSLVETSWAPLMWLSIPGDLLLERFPYGRTTPWNRQSPWVMCSWQCHKPSGEKRARAVTTCQGLNLEFIGMYHIHFMKWPLSGTNQMFSCKITSSVDFAEKSWHRRYCGCPLQWAAASLSCLAGDSLQLISSSNDICSLWWTPKSPIHHAVSPFFFRWIGLRLRFMESFG